MGFAQFGRGNIVAFAVEHAHGGEDIGHLPQHLFHIRPPQHIPFGQLDTGEADAFGFAGQLVDPA